MSSKEKVSIGFFGTLYMCLRSRRQLVRRIQRLEFKLLQEQEKVRDLKEIAGAYADALEDLRRGYRLEGMLHQHDIDRVAQPRD